MNRLTFDPSVLCEVGDTLYSCGCKNPYRALLTAASRDLNPQAIAAAFHKRTRSEALSDADRTLLSTFDAIVNESAERIDTLASERP